MTPRGLGRSTTRSRRLRTVALAITFGALALTLSGCSWQEVLGLGWPKGITPEAHTNRDLWLGSVIAAFVVGVIVWGLMFWTASFHRKKKGDDELPRQFGYNMPLELVLTVIPFIIISVLFYFTVVVQEKMMHQRPQPGSRHRRHRLPVELEVRLPEDRVQGRNLQLRGRRPEPARPRWCPSRKAPTPTARRSSARSAD